MTWEMKRLNYSHEALAEQILTNPSATNSQLGEVFGRTKEWVGMVKNSGMFRELMARKRGELIDPLVTEKVEDRLEMLTARSFEVLMEKMARPSQDIPDDLAMEAAKLGAKGMGFGGFSNRPAPPAELPKADRIERLADRLLSLNRPQGVTDVTDISQAQSLRSA